MNTRQRFTRTSSESLFARILPRWCSSLLVLLSILASARPAVAQTDAFTILGLLDVAGHIRSNIQQNRLDRRLEALENRPSDPESSIPNDEIIAEARQNLALIKYAAMPDTERRKLLVEAFGRARYNRGSLRSSPEFSAIRREAIELYLDRFASSSLVELFRAAKKNPDSADLRQIYVDTFLTELAVQKSGAPGRLPSLGPQELQKLARQAEAIASTKSSTSVLDVITTDLTALTASQADQLDRVVELRKTLGRQYGADPRSPLVSGTQGLSDGAGMARAAEQARAVDLSVLGEFTRQVKGVVDAAVRRGDADTIRTVGDHAGAYKRGLDLTTKLLLIGAAGGAVVGAALAATMAAGPTLATVLAAMASGAIGGGGLGFLLGTFSGVVNDKINKTRFKERLAGVTPEPVGTTPARGSATGRAGEATSPVAVPPSSATDTTREVRRSDATAHPGTPRQDDGISTDDIRLQGR